MRRLVWKLTKRWRCHCRGYHERTGSHADVCPKGRS